MDGPRGRPATAICQFCDTDFVGTDGPGGGRFADAAALWPRGRARLAGAAAAQPLVVCTGGEPLLQLDAPLIDALHARGFEIAVETNGTRRRRPGSTGSASARRPAPSGADARRRAEARVSAAGASPARFAGLAFAHFFLQPMDGPARAANTQAAIAYCLAHPHWRLSLQTHKLLGIA